MVPRFPHLLLSPGNGFQTVLGIDLNWVLKVCKDLRGRRGSLVRWKGSEKC